MTVMAVEMTKMAKMVSKGLKGSKIELEVIGMASKVTKMVLKGKRWR